MERANCFFARDLDVNKQDAGCQTRRFNRHHAAAPPVARNNDVTVQYCVTIALRFGSMWHVHVMRRHEHTRSDPRKRPGRPAVQFTHMHSTQFKVVFSGVVAPLSLHWPYTREPLAPITVRHVSHWIVGATGPRTRCSPNASPAKIASKVFQFLLFSHIGGGSRADPTEPCAAANVLHAL